jgi:hypothetical protein
MRVNDEGITNFEAQMPKGKHRGTRSSFQRSPLFRHLSFVICLSALAISFAFTLSLRGQSAPSAKDILASVRMMESRQQIDLQGQLRQDNIVVPFRLVQNGPEKAPSNSRPRSSSKRFAAPVSPTRIWRSNFSTGRPRGSWARRMFARAIAGSCNCARPRANRSIPTCYCG